jgi:hypothetical protein
MPKHDLGLAPWAVELARRVEALTEAGFHPLVMVVYDDGRRAIFVGAAITQAAAGGPAQPFIIDQAHPRPGSAAK